MSQQQQSVQQPQLPQQQKQPNWYFGLILTAIVTGVVSVFVNHFDAIAAAIIGLFSHVHVPPLQGTLIFAIFNTLFSIATVVLGVLAVIFFPFERARQKRIIQSAVEEASEETKRWLTAELVTVKEDARQFQAFLDALSKWVADHPPPPKGLIATASISTPQVGLSTGITKPGDLRITAGPPKPGGFRITTGPPKPGDISILTGPAIPIKMDEQKIKEQDHK